MKRILLLLLSLSIGDAVFAQQSSPTLIGSQANSKISGFGGPLIELSSLRGQSMVSIGGAGAACINGHFFFGGFGQSSTTKTLLSDNAIYNTDLSQGGFWLGYIFHPNRVVHITTDTKLGWTSATLTNTNTTSRTTQSGFTITPSVGAEVNVASFLRVQLTGGYRLASNFGPMQLNALSNKDVDSVVGTLTLRFGWFR